MHATTAVSSYRRPRKQRQRHRGTRCNIFLLVVGGLPSASGRGTGVGVGMGGTEERADKRGVELSCQNQNLNQEGRGGVGSSTLTTCIVLLFCSKFSTPEFLPFLPPSSHYLHLLFSFFSATLFPPFVFSFLIKLTLMLINQQTVNKSSIVLWRHPIILGY